MASNDEDKHMEEEIKEDHVGENWKRDDVDDERVSN